MKQFFLFLLITAGFSLNGDSVVHELTEAGAKTSVRSDRYRYAMIAQDPGYSGTVVQGSFSTGSFKGIGLMGLVMNHTSTADSIFAEPGATADPGMLWLNRLWCSYNFNGISVFSVLSEESICTGIWSTAGHSHGSASVLSAYEDEQGGSYIQGTSMELGAGSFSFFWYYILFFNAHRLPRGRTGYRFSLESDSAELDIHYHFAAESSRELKKSRVLAGETVINCFSRYPYRFSVRKKDILDVTLDLVRIVPVSVTEYSLEGTYSDTLNQFSTLFSVSVNYDEQEYIQSSTGYSYTLSLENISFRTGSFVKYCRVEELIAETSAGIEFYMGPVIFGSTGTVSYENICIVTGISEMKIKQNDWQIELSVTLPLFTYDPGIDKYQNTVFSRDFHVDMDWRISVQ